jgi:hypothetical protein
MAVIYHSKEFYNIGPKSVAIELGHYRLANIRLSWLTVFQIFFLLVPVAEAGL